MSRFVPESSLDHLAAFNGGSIGFALRGHRLRMRSQQATTAVRRALLEALSEAYLARGLGAEHRRHGSIATALLLEAQSDDRLAMARRYFCGAVPTGDFDVQNELPVGP